MRTILLASLALLLCSGLPGARCAEPQALEPQAPEPRDEAVTTPANPASPSAPKPFPGADPDPSQAAFEPEDAAGPAPAPVPDNPNAVTVRRPAILHWWDDPIFDRRITLKLENTDLNAAIDALGRSANMNLIAAGGTKARKKVTLNLRGAPLRDVMLALANLYGLIWFKSGEVYTLTYVTVSTKRLGVSAPSVPRPRRPVVVVPSPRPAPRR